MRWSALDPLPGKSRLQVHPYTQLPDYFSEAPGGVQQGRMLGSPLFDARQLDAWPERVRPRPKLPGNLIIATVDEFRQMYHVGRS